MFNHLKIDYDAERATIEVDGEELKCDKLVLIMEVGKFPTLWVRMASLSGELEVINGESK